jgi:hypothetical protein
VKLHVALLLCLIATSSAAQQFEFRGDLVGTYLVKEGFLDTIPNGTKLNCEGLLCSNFKAVRIYVFQNQEVIKKFWSTDYCDVMFDGPETMVTCGKSGHIAHYDETDQLLYREQVCRTVETNRVGEGVAKRPITLVAMH